MLPDIEQVKGVHPGAILNREFKQRGIKKSAFALSIGVYPGIITDITKYRRGIPAAIALKLEQALNAEEGYFLVLQAYYKIRQEQLKASALHPKPDLTKIRKGLFWDVDVYKLDYNRRKRFVVQRIFERGNDSEIQEIIRFYGKQECADIMKNGKSLLYSVKANSEKYLNINLDQ